MRWRYPLMLLGLLGAPLYVALEARLARYAPAIRHGSVASLPGPSKGSKTPALACRTLRALALSLIVLGLAHPETPSPSAERTIEGIDICLALDLSRSMRAEDFTPNRLEAAKATLRRFIRAREHDRIGLVVFAGDAFLQSPLTLDHNALETLLEQADFDLAPSDGTAIGDALVKAAARLRKSSAESRVIVLLTDGENNRGEVDPENATRIAVGLGIRVYTIGVGSEDGAPIPIDDPLTGREFVRHADGTRLLTALDEALLEKIAEQTGGRYFNARDQAALARALDELDRLETTEIDTPQSVAYRNVGHWFYFVAFIIVVIETVLTRTRLRVLPA